MLRCGVIEGERMMNDELKEVETDTTTSIWLEFSCTKTLGGSRYVVL